MSAALNYTLVVLLVVGVMIFGPETSAHNGENHSTVSDAELHKISELEQLEKIRDLLKQLLTLLMQKQKLINGEMSTAVTVVAEAKQVHTDGAASSSAATTPTSVESGKKLLIELETHDGKTHVHVRYVDKPEEMFFVDPPLSDIDGIASIVSARTGLVVNEVRAAFKLLQTNY